ncbi:MAG: DUF4367 domain-containing protein [Oscillospiraceae bacterium]|nr:DUF4367 domain-containing protein [Oscillospiraceae bacterium]
MDKNRNSEALYDRFADAAAALVMDQYVAALADRYAAEDAASVEVGGALDQRCRKSIKKGERKRLWERIGKRTLRVARVAVITFLILCGTFVVLFSTVEAFRVPVINFFINQTDKYLELTDQDVVFNDIDPYYLNPSDVGEDLLEGLLPDGYVPALYDESGQGDQTIMYKNLQNEEEFVFYNYYPMTGTLHVDTEDAVVENITIYGYEAILIQKHGYQLVWYYDGGAPLQILSATSLSREEVIALAEAIERRR